MLETHAALHYVALQQRSFDVADETKVEEKIEAVAETAAAPVKAVAEKVEASGCSGRRGQAGSQGQANRQEGRGSPCPQGAGQGRRGRQENQQARGQDRQARPQGGPKPVASVKQIEGTNTMTYDFNQLFAGFQLPGADKYQQLVAEAGERSQQFAAKSQKAAEELTDLAKANVEAIVEAGRIYAGGAKALGQDVDRVGP